jgi:hypothetical protein
MFACGQSIALESKINPEKRTEFKIKIVEYLKIEKESTRTITGMVLGREWI